MCVRRISMENEDQETNGRLDAPAKWKSPTKTNITTSINMDVWNLAKKENIAWCDALEFGVKFLISDKEGFDYPQSNLLEKLHKTVKHRNALALEVDALRQQVAGIDDVDNETKKDLDQVFGGVKEDEN